jgi:hypothetical protein
VWEEEKLCAAPSRARREGSVAAALEAALDAVAPAIEAAVDAIAFAVEAIRAPLVAVRVGDLRASVEAAVDAIALAVEPALDAVARVGARGHRNGGEQEAARESQRCEFHGLHRVSFV